MIPVTIIKGRGPIILAQPHSGTDVPLDIMANLNDLGRELHDTDWHIPVLYEGLIPDATIVRANFSRYVIDANRDPEGKSLYPGQNTTTLVPLTSFDGKPIWKRPPTDEEIKKRLKAFHEPYHSALRNELHRARMQYGFAILYDCHSIRSTIPHLFDGKLPDLNIGTNDGISCAPSISSAVVRICERQAAYAHVINGRFKGGWTTRHYGQPDNGIHAIQMELSQANYLQTEEPPFTYDTQGAAKLRDVLRDILNEIQKTFETVIKSEADRGQIA